MNTPRKTAFLAMLAALALAGCQKEAKAPESAAPEAKPGLSVSNGVLLMPVISGNPGAAYFDLANGGDKPVTLAAVSIDGAAKAEMHETTGGSMAPVAAVEVKPGETVKFARGGRHVMAFQIGSAVQVGGTVEMTLTFADGDKLSAPLKVESMSAGAAHGGMDHMGAMR